MQTLVITKESFIKSFAEMICELVNNSTIDVDMQDIEPAIKELMEAGEMQFKNYWQLLDDSVNKHLITKFETTEEYFFDAINRVNLPQWKSERLINECLIF